ncbi:MAG: hypothetical protein GYA17_03865 [Chloroflexi bacterium]|nr:hypothetical protein [Anaerolineaceae bacterium]NMB87471.1 hypothetical protein [Chloroflexota bacterium]
MNQNPSSNQSSRPARPADAQPSRPSFLADKIGPLFWTVACFISLVVNVVLIVALVVMGNQLFAMKNSLTEELVGGLYGNFVLMDEAHIRTTIPVSTQVPARFDLPLETDTVVTLTEDTYIQGASVSLVTGGLAINSAPTNITLPAGTRLPVHLSLMVPVDQTIPVDLTVAVDIPLSQTELHQPFVGLQEVVRPYYLLLNHLPNSWEETLCGPAPSEFCQKVVP